MAYLRRPEGSDCLDVPFNYDGFKEAADAEDAIMKRAYKDLGWRIEEIECGFLPVEHDLSVAKPD